MLPLDQRLGPQQSLILDQYNLQNLKKCKGQVTQLGQNRYHIRALPEKVLQEKRQYAVHPSNTSFRKLLSRKTLRNKIKLVACVLQPLEGTAQESLHRRVKPSKFTALTPHPYSRLDQNHRFIPEDEGHYLVRIQTRTPTQVTIQTGLLVHDPRLHIAQSLSGEKRTLRIYQQKRSTISN